MTHRVSVGNKEFKVECLDCLMATASKDDTLLLCFREISDADKHAVMLLTTALASCG